MKSRLVIVLIVACMLFSSSGLIAQNSNASPNLGRENQIGRLFPNPGSAVSEARIRLYMARINRAYSAKDYRTAVKLSEGLVEVLPNFHGLTKDRINQVTEGLYREQIKSSYENLGQYNQAAAAIRSASAINRSPADVKAVLELTQSHTRQQEYTRVRDAFFDQRIELIGSQLPLVNRKQALIDRFNKMGVMNEKTIAALQKQLAEVDAGIKKIQREINQKTKEYKRQIAELNRPPLKFTAAQQKQFSAMQREYRKVVTARNSSQAQVNRRLAEIVERHQVSWSGLKPALEELSQIQQKILTLKARMEALANPPVNQDKIAAADKLAQELDNLMEQESALYSRIEEAFMSQEAFDNLTLKEQAELVKLFHSAFMRHQKVIAPPTIADIMVKIRESFERDNPPSSEPPTEPQPDWSQVFRSKDGKYYWPNPLRGMPASPDTIITQVIAELTIEEMAAYIDWLTRDNVRPTPKPLPEPQPEPQPQPRQVPNWSRVIEMNGQLYWPDGGRGDRLPPGTNVTMALVPLTPEEVAAYKIWLQSNRPGERGTIIDQQPDSSNNQAPRSLLDSF